MKAFLGICVLLLFPIILMMIWGETSFWLKILVTDVIVLIFGGLIDNVLNREV